MGDAVKIPCPHCGEPNVIGSNICGACLRHMGRAANPFAEDDIATVFAAPPKPGLWQRIKRWWNRR